MKKIIITLIALVCSCAAFAVPAWRGLIRYTQPDGSVIMLQKHGDEFFHWTTTADGEIVEKDADGYWRPVNRESFNNRRKAAKARRTAVIRTRKAGEHIAIGQKHFLVILTEFSDVTFQSETPKQDFYNLLNQNGYSANGGKGSARDYYYDNSHGIFEPIFDVYGPVKLDNPMSYYGGNTSSGDDKAPELAVKQTCQKLDSQVDFSKYDNDGDGSVDLVFMYYAGYGEADSDEENSIWPHQWSLSEAGTSLSLDNTSVDKYACTNELVGYGGYAGKMCGIGTACHEFGHAMGLPDFYDTDYDTNGQAAAMFGFSLMDSGSYNDDGHTPPFFTTEERILLGWITDDVFLDFTKSGMITLPSVNEHVAYRSPTDTEGEYFVYECRGNNGWDAGLPAHGLIVTHVDKSSRKISISNGESWKNVSAKTLWEEWETDNAINENGKHPCCYVVPAADQSNLMFGYKYYSGYGYYYESVNDPKIPFPGSTNTTTYIARSWNEVDSEISLSDIQYSNDQVRFMVYVPSDELDYTVISNPGNGVYAAGSMFDLSLEESEARPAVSVEWYFDDEPESGSSVLLRAGAHTVEAVITLDSGEIQTVTLELQAQ